MDPTRGANLTLETFERLWQAVREEAGKPLSLAPRTRELPDFAVDTFIRALGDGEALAGHLRNTIVSPRAYAMVLEKAPEAARILGMSTHLRIPRPREQT